MDHGYINLLGAIIRQAIIDYQSVKSRNINISNEIKNINSSPLRNRNSYSENSKVGILKVKLHSYESARWYLFSSEGLERQLHIFGLSHKVSIDYIRSMINRKIIDSRKDFIKQNLILKDEDNNEEFNSKDDG